MSSPAVFLRLFTDDGGDTHFEEVEVAMSPVQYAPPLPPLTCRTP